MFNSYDNKITTTFWITWISVYVIGADEEHDIDQEQEQEREQYEPKQEQDDVDTIVKAEPNEVCDVQEQWRHRFFFGLPELNRVRLATIDIACYMFKLISLI